MSLTQNLNKGNGRIVVQLNKIIAIPLTVFVSPKPFWTQITKNKPPKD